MKRSGCPNYCACLPCAWGSYSGLAWEFYLDWRDWPEERLRLAALGLASGWRRC